MENSTPGQVLTLLVTSENGSSFEIVPVTLGVAPISHALENNEIDQSKTQDPESSASIIQLEEAIFSEVNRVRLEHRLGALRDNALLQRSARSHSEQMVARKFFSHIDHNGKDVLDRLQAQGVDGFRSAGENIYAGQNISNVVDSVIQGWMNSPGHKRNLLSPNYQEAGVGLAIGNKGKVYVTQVYLESF
jgi:uncharacterized protein YkwD